jgi:hypothetical protein
VSRNARTLERLRAQGWTPGVVETWNPHPAPGHHVDLWNAIDVIAVKADTPWVLGVQTCKRGEVAAHLHKAVASPGLAVWLAAGNVYEIWAWYKRHGLWETEIVAVEGADMRPVVKQKPRRRLPNRHHQGELF